jgi:hypothetical protein
VNWGGPRDLAAAGGEGRTRGRPGRGRRPITRGWSRLGGQGAERGHRGAPTVSTLVLARLLRAFVVRPIGYDPRAHVYTATPTTVRGLWRQRVRWNSSRLWLFQRFGLLPAFAWSMGGPVALEMVLLLAMNVVVLVGLVAWPLVDRPSAWLSLVALSYLLNTAIRGGATLLAMIQDEDVRGQWHKLLALPLSATFHLVFNIATATTGLVQDIFLHGVHTTFAPETTLERSGTGRIAIAYRLRRAAMLALRAIRRGDVPLGWFWLGFHRTPWTPSGYAGWTVARASRRRRTRAGFPRGRERRPAGPPGRGRPAGPRPAPDHPGTVTARRAGRRARRPRRCRRSRLVSGRRTSARRRPAAGRRRRGRAGRR